MGLNKAFTGAITGTLADQWKEIITVDDFDEHTVVARGVLKSTNNRRGANLNGSTDIISNGSIIYVPENVAAFIFSQSEIEEVITEPGGYEYQNGQSSIFNNDNIVQSLFNQAKERVGYGGISADEKRVVFVNLREIRDIKFGTRGALVYNDSYYGTDLEIQSYGSFTIQIKDTVKFMKNFVPANVTSYSFDDMKVRSQILSEFLQSFTGALNSLSDTYRISQLPNQSNAISRMIAIDSHNAGKWGERFGFELIKVAIENITFTEDSRELVRQYSSNKMNVKAYDDVTERASNIASQQRIAQGIQNNGLGNAGEMIFGMNLAQGLGTNVEPVKKMTFDEQVETLKRFKELMDVGVLTEDEFNEKKREILGL